MRAILSVYDKTGVVDFARGLEALGFELFSTGGTEGLLREAGVNVRGVQELTGFPEMLGGRVKTLHPAVHGGILALRDDPGHIEELARQGLKPIDIVVSNLYPFVEVARDSGARLSQALEHGVKVTGCTIHLVTDEVDSGPILMQRCLEVREDDDVASLHARIREQEHQLLTLAVRAFAEDRVCVEGRRARVIPSA